MGCIFNGSDWGGGGDWFKNKFLKTHVAVTVHLLQLRLKTVINLSFVLTFDDVLHMKKV